MEVQVDRESQPFGLGDDVNEVRAGTECGIGVKNYNDVKAGDQIECFEVTEIAQTL